MRSASYPNQTKSLKISEIRVISGQVKEMADAGVKFCFGFNVFLRI